MLFPPPVGPNNPIVSPGRAVNDTPSNAGRFAPLNRNETPSKVTSPRIGTNATVNATLDVIQDEGLVANAAERGRQFLTGLKGLKEKYGSIGDARGLGLMVALEFVKPGEGDGRIPDPDLTKRVQAEALARNLIVLTAGTYVNVVRIIPPLVTTSDEVDLALSILDESLAAAGA